MPESMLGSDPNTASQATETAQVLRVLQKKMAATHMPPLWPAYKKTKGGWSKISARSGYADGKSLQFRLLILSNCSLSQPMTSRRNRPTMIGRNLSLRTAVVSS